MSEINGSRFLKVTESSGGESFSREYYPIRPKRGISGKYEWDKVAFYKKPRSEEAISNEQVDIVDISEITLNL